MKDPIITYEDDGTVVIEIDPPQGWTEEDVMNFIRNEMPQGLGCDMKFVVTNEDK